MFDCMRGMFRSGSKYVFFDHSRVVFRPCSRFTLTLIELYFGSIVLEYVLTVLQSCFNCAQDKFCRCSSYVLTELEACTNRVRGILSCSNCVLNMLEVCFHVARGLFLPCSTDF